MIPAPSKETYVTYAALIAIMLIPQTRDLLEVAGSHLRSFVTQMAGYDTAFVIPGFMILFITMAAFRIRGKKKLH